MKPSILIAPPTDSLVGIITKDSIRYGGRNFIRVWFRDPRFRAILILRIGQNLEKRNFIFKSFLLLLLKNRLLLKYGLDTTFKVKIGGGLKIIHLGGIVIHGSSFIGHNATINNNVTLGQSLRGKENSLKVPHIGNNVFIGVGSVLIGDITLGDNVTVGAQTLVNKSFDSNSIIVGIPGRLLKLKH